jgi:hypothetical protein
MRRAIGGSSRHAATHPAWLLRKEKNASVGAFFSGRPHHPDQPVAPSSPREKRQRTEAMRRRNIVS